jgi:hypothetical protein
MIKTGKIYTDRSRSKSCRHTSSGSDSGAMTNRCSWSESRKGSTYMAKSGTGKKTQSESFAISRTGTKVASRSHS